LDLERGQVLARPGERFRIRLSDGGELEVPVPDHRLPDLKKISAGYFASDPMDLIDLFIGAEGTLGLITSVTLDVVPLPRAVVTGLLVLGSLAEALALVAELRETAERARARGDPLGPDVRAVEFMDGNCLRLLREAGVPRDLRIDVPDDAEAALLFEMELPEPTSNRRAQELLEGLLDGRRPPEDRPLTRLFRVLQRHGTLDRLQFAFPEDRERRRALGDFREAAPRQVFERLAQRHRHDPEVKKVGGDLIVPFRHLAEMMDVYRDGFAGRGLEYAIWGHLSDGNLHPNAIARSADEVRSGYEALLEFADHAIRLGGCPLSEHGVGRSPIKQETLRRFLGDRTIARMREIKRALDPPGRIAPGVLFPAG
jgi:D-lactate dehydrogenase (cytochrome)